MNGLLRLSITIFNSISLQRLKLNIKLRSLLDHVLFSQTEVLAECLRGSALVWPALSMSARMSRFAKDIQSLELSLEADYSSDVWRTLQLLPTANTELVCSTRNVLSLILTPISVISSRSVSRAYCSQLNGADWGFYSRKFQEIAKPSVVRRRY